MADESLEGFRFAGHERAREFGLALLVHATIVTCLVAQPARQPSAGVGFHGGIHYGFDLRALRSVWWTRHAFTARKMPSS